MAHIVDFSHSRAERIFRDGIRYEERGRFEEALRAFEQVVHLNPSHVEAHLRLAAVNHHSENYEEAVHHASVAVALKPSAEAHFALGHAQLALRDTLAALDQFRACLALDPDFAEARYQIAFAYYLQGDYEIAITEFHRAAHHTPDWETLFFMGECYRMTMRPAEAERAFRKALNVASSWTQVELTRGQLEAAARLAEFPDGHIFTMKDRLYCDVGTVYLGTTRDDGVHIPPYLVHHFTYEDVARTLARLTGLAEARGWRWDSVVPADDASMPLAIAIARLLRVPERAQEAERPLVVQAVGEALPVFREAAEAARGVNSFVLLTCWPDEWHADITGIITPLIGSVPWTRPPPANTPQRELSAEAIAQEILAQVRRLPAEANVTAQLDYYHRHRRLRWET
jgi:tetratricopeptide (TPR) repeat protein